MSATDWFTAKNYDADHLCRTVVDAGMHHVVHNSGPRGLQALSDSSRGSLCGGLSEIGGGDAACEDIWLKRCIIGGCPQPAHIPVRNGQFSSL